MVEISHTLQGNPEKQANFRTTTVVMWVVPHLTSRFFFLLFFCYVLYGGGCWKLHDNREFLLLSLLSVMTKTSSLIWKSLIFTGYTSILYQSTTKIPLCIQLNSTTNKELTKREDVYYCERDIRDIPYNRVTYTVRQIVQRFARWRSHFGRHGELDQLAMFKGLYRSFKRISFNFR